MFTVKTLISLHRQFKSNKTDDQRSKIDQISKMNFDPESHEANGGVNDFTVVEHGQFSRLDRERLFAWLKKPCGKDRRVFSPGHWYIPSGSDAYMEVYFNEAQELSKIDLCDSQGLSFIVGNGLYGFYCVVEGVPIRVIPAGDRIADLHKNIESLSGQLRSANKLRNAGDDVGESLIRISKSLRGAAEIISILGQS